MDAVIRRQLSTIFNLKNTRSGPTAKIPRRETLKITVVVVVVVVAVVMIVVVITAAGTSNA